MCLVLTVRTPMKRTGKQQSDRTPIPIPISCDTIDSGEVVHE